MKNMIFACCAIAALLLCTAVSAIGINRFTDEMLYLIRSGCYEDALAFFNEKRDVVSLAVNGDILQRLHESLVSLAAGDTDKAKIAEAACEEIASREKFSFAALF